MFLPQWDQVLNWLINVSASVGYVSKLTCLCFSLCGLCSKIPYLCFCRSLLRSKIPYLCFCRSLLRSKIPYLCFALVGYILLSLIHVSSSVGYILNAIEYWGWSWRGRILGVWICFDAPSRIPSVFIYYTFTLCTWSRE